MKRILLIAMITTIIASCSKDSDDQFDSDLQGTWTLINASCFCGFGENPDFSGHKLIFQGANLTVENMGEFKFLIDGSGTYLKNSGIITLENGRRYTYAIKGNTDLC